MIVKIYHDVTKRNEDMTMNQYDNQKNYERIVLKVGTSSLTYPDGSLNEGQIESICHETTNLQNQGKKVIIVTSGAIGAGMGKLGLQEKPERLEMKQALAAIGQANLIQIYQEYFSKENQLCAQVLLTKDVVTDELQRKNVIRTFQTLLDLGVIPIVNENDTVSTDEIEGVKFSDNDHLSAVVSSLTSADFFIIFSDIFGLQKKINGKLTGEIIEYVHQIDESVYQHVIDAKSKLGTGGMVTKLKSIELAVREGIDTVLCHYSMIHQLSEMIQGKNVGTFFKGVK